MYSDDFDLESESLADLWAKLKESLNFLIFEKLAETYTDAETLFGLSHDSVKKLVDVN